LIDEFEVLNQFGTIGNIYGPESLNISRPIYTTRENAFIHPIIRYSGELKFIDCF